MNNSSSAAAVAYGSPSSTTAEMMPPDIHSFYEGEFDMDLPDFDNPPTSTAETTLATGMVRRRGISSRTRKSHVYKISYDLSRSEVAARLG